MATNGTRFRARVTLLGDGKRVFIEQDEKGPDARTYRPSGGNNASHQEFAKLDPMDVGEKVIKALKGQLRVRKKATPKGTAQSE